MLVSTFTLGDLYLGIDIILVREINRSLECTPVPGAPEFIRGMLNIRGRVITLFNLKRRLAWNQANERTIKSTDTSSKKKHKQYNVILKTNPEVQQISQEVAKNKCPWADPVGLIVDELGDVREIADDAILPAPANLKGISADFVHGVVEIQNNLLIILNVAAVLGMEEKAA